MKYIVYEYFNIFTGFSGRVKEINLKIQLIFWILTTFNILISSENILPSKKN